MARVLVVEDDQDIRALLERRLVTAGHRVLGAASAEEALSLLDEKGAPEVVVSDVSMPGMSGLELLDHMRSDPALAGIAAVLLSGRVLPADIAAGQALDAVYLTKPVVLSALLSAIERALAVKTPAVQVW